jgi:hypothetical protein
MFSSKPETTEWPKWTIVRGDVAAEVIKLKQQDGGDLLVLGHGLLGAKRAPAWGHLKRLKRVAWRALSFVQSLVRRAHMSPHRFDLDIAACARLSHLSRVPWPLLVTSWNQVGS